MPVNLNQSENTEKNKKEDDILQKLNDYLINKARVPLKEKLFFVQYLSVMIKSGIPLAQALKTLANQTENKKFKLILKNIHANVEKGLSFSESLKKYLDIFGELFINMVEVGEISGKLENVLEQLYIQLKKQNELMSKVKGALIYPIVILVAMLGVGTFMMIFIIPKMLTIFKDTGSGLPLPTRLLIFVSNQISQNGVIIAIVLVAFVIITIKVLKTSRGKKAFETVLLRAPVIGPIIKKINLARFSRTISSLLKTDIMIVKTFQITSNVLDNVHYKEAVSAMSEEIKKGGAIAQVIGLYPNLFPAVVYQMVAVGEETGRLDAILDELAEFYEKEVNQIMDNIPSIIEPILLIVLGCGVAVLAVAIIMPMYSMNSAVTK